MHPYPPPTIDFNATVGFAIVAATILLSITVIIWRKPTLGRQIGIVVVAIAFCALLAGLVIPAINAARPAMQRTICR